MENSRVEEHNDPNQAAALEYFNNLMNNGVNEGDSGNELKMPEYYNAELFRKGQSYMQKYRLVLQTGMLSGLVAGLSINFLTKVLISTGQSSTAATAYRRYVRTYFYVLSWYYYSPVPENSKFWASLRKVRQIHISLSRNRNHLRINQMGMAITQIGFMGFATLRADIIQMDDEEEFLEATIHMWRVLGYLLGIKDEYNVCGTNWSETKPRFELVSKEILQPALSNTSEDFDVMSKAVIDGLWPTNITLTYGSFLYLVKNMVGLKGYEYFDFEFSENQNAQKHLYYRDLSWLDRINVFCMLYTTTYLYRYTIFRWFLNVQVWLLECIIYYLPIIAIYKFGLKWAYVRIFTKNGKAV